MAEQPSCYVPGCWASIKSIDSLRKYVPLVLVLGLSFIGLQKWKVTATDLRRVSSAFIVAFNALTLFMV